MPQWIKNLTPGELKWLGIFTGLLFVIIYCSAWNNQDAEARHCAAQKNGMSYDTCFYQLNH